MLDLKRVNVQPADIWCKATDHIPEQIQMIEGLMAKGFAYQAGDAVYYDVSKFPRYADLARKDRKAREAGARIAPSDGKRNHEDFALWKVSPPARSGRWNGPALGAPASLAGTLNARPCR